jgi:hypothetical protein
MPMISISGVSLTAESQCVIEVDEYVPIRYRSYQGVIGVKYLRLGDFTSSLIELLIDPTSLTVRGFTLLSYKAIHRPSVMRKLPKILGMPIVAVNEGDFCGAVGAQRVDQSCDFSVGFGEDFVEIDLGHLTEAQRIIKAGTVEFYSDETDIFGIRITELTPTQMCMLKRPNA